MLSGAGLLRAGLALATGAACALLVACGSSSSGAGLIPADQAGPLKADFELVAHAAANAEGDCTKTEAALAKTERDFNRLPSSLNAALHQRLAEGIENLRSVAIERCSQPPTGTTGETTTVPKTTTTTTTPTETTRTTTTPEEETGGAPVPVEPGGKKEQEEESSGGGGASAEKGNGSPGGGAGGTEVR
jgi:hypothetical protein